MADVPVLETLKALLAKSKKSLRWYRQVGACLKKLNDAQPYGTRYIRALARRLNCSHSTFYRAMQVAGLYKASDIEELRGLTASALPVLLAVKDDRLRNQLQRQAVRHHWSYRRLQREVDRRRGKLPARGGRTRKPGDLSQETGELIRMCTKWRAFVRDVWPATRISELAGDELPRVLNAADNAMRRLIATLEQAPHSANDLPTER